MSTKISNLLAFFIATSLGTGTYTTLWSQTVKARRPYIEWSAVPSSSTWQYGVGDEAEVNVSIRSGGLPANDIWVHYTVGNDMMQPERQDSVVVREGKATVSMGVSQKAGFRTCRMWFTANGNRYEDLVKVGYGVDQIKAYATMPKDFKSFWTETIAAARSIDLNPQIEEMADKSTDRVAAYKVRLTVGLSKGQTRYVYCYLSIPRDQRRHPVLLVPPGAGVKMDAYSDFYAKEGFVSMSMEIHGMDPDLEEAEKDSIRGALRNYMSLGIESRETYYYRLVYAVCVRAMDYLCSRPEWDGEHAGVTGGSQGGALSIVTAALHERVGFVAAFYPALCDVSAYVGGQACGWPRFFSPVYAGKDKMGEGIGAEIKTKALGTLPYYDVVNFGRMLAVPCFASYGHADEVCPPTSVAAMLNTVSAPKTIVVTPTSAHWRFAETQAKAIEWMKEQSGVNGETEGTKTKGDNEILYRD
ncbi:MAG: acetylxylan esterase [Marinilabiliaceae bacterium]